MNAKTKILVLAVVFFISGMINGVTLSAEPVAVADAQTISLGEREMLLRLRSSGPQAFDLLDSPNPLVTKVRLHNAVLREFKGLDAAPEFGSVTITQETDDKVLVEILCKESGYKVQVSQGNSLDAVEIRVIWAPDAKPPVISALNVSEIAANSAVIKWTTDEASDSQIVFGTSQPETDTSGVESDLVTNHQITLAGLLPKTSYYYAVKSRDAAGNLASSSSSLFTTRALAFQEIGGLVSIEAENSDERVSRNGKSWLSESVTPGYSGTGYAAVGPNTGQAVTKDFVGSAAEIAYNIKFTKTGTYYIWLRGRGISGNDDSVHAGIDNTGPQSADNITGFTVSWKWSRSTMDGPAAAFNVLTPGVHTFHLWMREDGVVLDKIMLTTSSSSTAPNASGPPESQRV